MLELRKISILKMIQQSMKRLQMQKEDMPNYSTNFGALKKAS